MALGEHHSNNYKIAKKAIILSILGNLVLALIKGIAGFLGNSFALIADGIESMTDVLSSSLALIGLNYAAKPPDDDHPYGHGKAEPLMTFVIVLFLIGATCYIVYESIQNILHPHAPPKAFTLYILAGIILSKEMFYRVISKKGKDADSSMIQADAWHHRSDAITSLAAFIGIAIALYMGEGWASADDWAALVACAVILYNAYLIFRPALGEILDEHIYDDFIDEIRETSCEIDGVLGTEKCFIRKHGMQYLVDLHLLVNAQITVKQGHDISHDVKKKLMEVYPEILDVLIHIEPFNPDKVKR
ncbi:cation diffusion facilitator family transporter [Flavobacteriaceae bacterium Ap0902]|nr:cation diffusion facilitator family transporter [Flavobacteriaceae bacterium Ap0902]